ncbi:unnamed protein product [Bursaphelenchus xylophilus]|uniref:(pine wood nematode) hypothetical protein n=1 Tax=Bursaphelenchus xylophilus TaxID=6326 RepID=A0A1I7RKW3_BURXY|nr:unnamed protein product [Bursaphelenchus xylophilus]CAG9083795.1 unnamed protein product [Bursaphelenchus xylophilus]
MQIHSAKPINIVTTLYKKSTSELELQTDPVKLLDNGTDPISQPFKQTQTEKPEEKMLSARQIRLDEKVVNTVIEQLQQMEIEKSLFEELDTYHADKKVQLELIRKVRIDVLEDIPLHSIRCSADKRICALFGMRSHDVWCLHAGRLLLWERTNTSWISLNSCPSQVLFGSQKQVVVGTATGSVCVVVGSDTVWSSDQMHFQTISSLRFISSKMILSTAMDGRLVVSNLQMTGLEPVKSASVNVSDLPRGMRKSNNSATKVSAVDSTMDSFQLFVATETGAILLVDPETLTTTPVGYDPDGIDAFQWIDDKFLVISAADGGVKLLDRNGKTLDRLDCKADTRQYCFNGKVFVFLNGAKITGYDLEKTKKLFDENLHLLSADFDADGYLVGMDEEYNLNWFELNYSN